MKAGGQVWGHVQDENGGAGVYSMDLRKLYKLAAPGWNHDIIPEIMNGHNIADFVDAEIEEKLRELDMEEDQMAEEWLKQVDHIFHLYLAAFQM